MTVTVLPPLTARFVNAPQNHAGRGREFQLEIHFSENVDLNATAIRGLLTIDGGTHRNQRRMPGGERNQRWQVDIVPDGAGDVTIVLPANVACGDPDAAPCTYDGRPLSADVRVTVLGPGRVPLTARFLDGPGSHDGVNTFQHRHPLQREEHGYSALRR